MSAAKSVYPLYITRLREGSPARLLKEQRWDRDQRERDYARANAECTERRSQVRLVVDNTEKDAQS